MNIPSREKCEELLLKYNFPERKRRHVEKVASVAVYFAGKINEKICKQKNAYAQNCLQNETVNLDLVYAGGILHDIDKGVEGAGVVHPQKAVEILRAEGYPEVARICETHTINAFLDLKTVPSTWEEKCVALADKMVKNEAIGVTERFRLWREEIGEELTKVPRVPRVSRVPRGENTDGEQGKQVSNERDNWEEQKNIIEKSYGKVKKLESEILGVIGMEAEDIVNNFK